MAGRLPITTSAWIPRHPSACRIPFQDSLKITYPGGQRGAVVSITVVEPAAPPGPWKDMSNFDAVSVELRGARGRESVSVGIKDLAEGRDADNARVALKNVATKFKTYTIPLSQFAANPERVSPAQCCA